MAGLTIGTDVAMTVTNLHSLAADNTAGGGITGWSSDGIDCKAGSMQDVLLSVQFVSHGSNRQAGSMDIFVYASLNDTPTWPDIFSSGTEGSQGAVTVTDQEFFGTALKFVASIPFDTTASDPGSISQEGIAKFFGMVVPSNIAFFIRGNITTTTTAQLAASGSSVTYFPVTAA